LFALSILNQSIGWFQVGNPYLDDYKNEKGSLEFLWNHGVMSDEVWAAITEHCSFGPSEDLLCHKAKASFQTGNIDGYNIYAPICIKEPNGTTHSIGYVSTYKYSLRSKL